MKSNQISPGTVLLINKKYYKVESAVKVTVAKGTPFLKTRLRELSEGTTIEKNFKPDQEVKEIKFKEKVIEYLYPEKKDYFFLDIDTLDHLLVPNKIVGDRINYLKEGIQVKATLCGDLVFSIELPQFLEIMVLKTEGENDEDKVVSNATKWAILETGARLEVPMFIEMGDMIKLDTSLNEYIQRI